MKPEFFVAAGTVLSAEQARWPLSRLKHLGLHKTHVTGECLPHLEHLEGLQFLDARSALWIHIDDVMH